MTLLSKFTLANCKQLQNICEKLASYPTTLISLRSDENLSLDVAIGINESFIVELPCNTLRKPVADNVRKTHIKIYCANIVDVCNCIQKVD